MVTYLRVYTRQFAQNILKAYETWCQRPATERGDMRARRHVDTKLTDRDFFSAMPIGDIWVESRIHEVYMYLWGCKYCVSLVYIGTSLPVTSIDG